nr:hypothetical protein [uncultured Sphingomonas sp.]
MAATRASSVEPADKDRLPWLGELREPVAKKGHGWLASGLSLVVLGGMAGGFALLWSDLRPLDPAKGQIAAKSGAPVAPAPSNIADGPSARLASTAAPSHDGPSATAPSRPRSSTPARASAKAIRTASIDRSSFERVAAIQAGDSGSAAPGVATNDRPAKPNMKAAMLDAMAATLSTIPSPAESQLAQSVPTRPAVNPAAKVVRKQTIRMGVYLTAAQADVAWRAAVRDYTYLVTMPRQVAPVTYRGRRYYQLNLGTPSRNHAMQLCRNLKSIGHNCSVA